MKFIDNCKAIAKKTQINLAKNAPAILTGFSVAGTISATVMGIKVTPEAMCRIDNLKAQYGENNVPFIEYFKALAPLYGPTVAMVLISGGCAIASQSMNSNRQARMEALYASVTTAAQKYQEKVIETIGERKEENIQRETDRQAVADTEDSLQERNILRTGYGDELCYDKFCGRYFYADMETIRRAFNDLNADILRYNFASVNTFYEYLNLETTDVGYMLGWNVDDYEIQPSISTQLVNGRRSCIVFGFRTPPHFGYSERW